MVQTYMTVAGRTVLFLSLLLFFIGYLFMNLIPPLCGVMLLVFLVYTKQSFRAGQGELPVQRTVIESLRFVNHPVYVKTTIKNTGGIRILRIHDMLPEDATVMQGDQEHQQVVDHNDEVVIDYQLIFSHRGTHTLDTLDVEISDRWRLYQQHQTLSQKLEFTVHSDPEEIQKAKRVSSREHLEITLPSRLGVETLYDMEGIREYIPGDQLRDIEWKATSRLQKMMTKLYHKQQTVETIILLDCSRTMRRALGKVSKLEHATVLAVQLSKILQSMRHTVGLIAYDEFKTLVTIDPSYRYQQIFEELAHLPSTIHTNGYQPMIEQDIPSLQEEEIHARQRFLSTVFPFLARGRRTIQTPTQASGLYEAVRLLLKGSTSKHIIILTDLETNLQSMYASVRLIHARKYPVWVLAFLTPTYYLTQATLTTEQLEQLYTAQSMREKIILKMKRRYVQVIDVTPVIEGGTVMETVRRKKR